MGISISVSARTKDKNSSTRRRSRHEDYDRRGRFERDRRGGRARYDEPQSQSSWPLVLGMTGVLAVGAAGLGYFAWQDANALKPDHLGCYPQEDQAHTAILMESSLPGPDAAQWRDIRTALSDKFLGGSQANERFQIFSTNPDDIGSIPAPVIETCVPPGTQAELEALGAPTQSQAYLKTQKLRVFEDKIADPLAQMQDEDKSNPQKFESPVGQQIQSLSRMPELQAGNGSKSLWVISDLIQNTQGMRFCQEKGHMPRFETFKSGQHYGRIKPRSLEVVDVTVLMLIRADYGPFCTGEDEVRQWWEAYFHDAGAQSIEFIRLRSDATGGQ